MEVEVPECEAELVVDPLLESEVIWVAVEVKVKGVEAVVELWPVARGVDEAWELLPAAPEPEVGVTVGRMLK